MQEELKFPSILTSWRQRINMTYLLEAAVVRQIQAPITEAKEELRVE